MNITNLPRNFAGFYSPQGRPLTQPCFWQQNLESANVTDINLAANIKEKITENEGKYPVAMAKGRAVKYTEL